MNWIRHTQCADGVTLIDSVISILVYSVSAFVVTLVFVHITNVLNLQSTATTLTYRLRALQQMATAEGTYTQIRMSIYSPTYRVFQGTYLLGSYSFAPGVDYYDGYLHMSSGNFLYDILGNGQMAGKVQLVSAGLEEDLQLYMGSGYVTLGAVHHEPH